LIAAGSFTALAIVQVVPASNDLGSMFATKPRSSYSWNQIRILNAHLNLALVTSIKQQTTSKKKGKLQ
jgi:hypothetical protein